MRLSKSGNSDDGYLAVISRGRVTRAIFVAVVIDDRHAESVFAGGEGVGEGELFDEIKIVALVHGTILDFLKIGAPGEDAIFGEEGFLL